jgi:hypothetical protein
MIILIISLTEESYDTYKISKIISSQIHKNATMTIRDYESYAPLKFEQILKR